MTCNRQANVSFSVYADPIATKRDRHSLQFLLSRDCPFVLCGRCSDIAENLYQIRTELVIELVTENYRFPRHFHA